MRRFAVLMVFAVSATTAWAGGEFGPVPPIQVKPELAALGKRLFFDPRLSGDQSLSCSSCHNPENGYGDGLALSEAYPGSRHFRNAPTLINSAHRQAWMHDGRLGTNQA